MYNLFNKFLGGISVLLLHSIHVCNSDNPINWLKQPNSVHDCAVGDFA